ncbi:MAG: hypothetical protein H3C43_10190 [Leptonema sp. (in: Bacteria)]|nr:hypothetical protein [Leptonema sp. (in: bacteria)]
MKRFIICNILFFISIPVFGHTLYLKDGRVIQGQIVAQTRTEVKINVNGKMLTFLKTEIKQMDFDTQITKPTKPVQKKEEEKTTEVKVAPLNRWNVAGRSALLPGWGHYAAGEKWTATGYLGLTSILALYTYQKRSNAISAKSNYESQTALNFLAMSSTNLLGDPTLNLLGSSLIGATIYNGYQTKVAEYNQALQLLALAYTGQIVHAYFTGRSLEGKNQSILILPFTDQNNRSLVGFFYNLSF